MATVLVYVAARVLGAQRLSALISAALSCLLIRYSVLLGIAALPEVPCAALMLFGASTLARPDRVLRALGGLALSAACLSRYEAWPLTLVFLGFCLYDAGKHRNVTFAMCGALGVAGLAWWLEIGRIHHGHALFFVSRVIAYKQALGGAQPSVLNRLLEYPKELLRQAPELWLLMLLVLLLTRKSSARREVLASGRIHCALLAVLVFLIVGSVRGGVPTHHAARVLLPLWFFGCVAIGPALAQVVIPYPRWINALTVIVISPTVFLMSAPHLYEFANRAPELEAGRAARRFSNGSLAIDTPDYGYLAVQAAFGTPIGTRALDEHDPRHPDPDPFASPQALEAALRARGARFALVRVNHAPLLTPSRGFSELWRSAAFVLFAWQPPAHS